LKYCCSSVRYMNVIKAVPLINNDARLLCEKPKRKTKLKIQLQMHLPRCELGMQPYFSEIFWANLVGFERNSRESLAKFRRNLGKIFHPQKYSIYGYVCHQTLVKYRYFKNVSKYKIRLDTNVFKYILKCNMQTIMFLLCGLYCVRIGGDRWLNSGAPKVGGGPLFSRITGAVCSLSLES